MTTQTNISGTSVGTSVATGANIVALAGLGLIGYGLMFLVRNFAGFTELGLTSELVGGTPQEIQAFSQNLYNYISHLQVALSGFIIALGLVVIALARFGIRHGENWALWTAFLAPVVAVGIALPLHYPFHFATLGHLGLIYIDAALLLLGTIISYRRFRGNTFTKGLIVQNWSVRSGVKIDNTDTSAPGDSVEVVSPWGHSSRFTTLTRFSWVTGLAEMSGDFPSAAHDIQVAFRISDTRGSNRAAMASLPSVEQLSTTIACQSKP